MALPYTSSFDQTIGFTETSYPFQLATGVVTTITLPGNKIQKYVLTFGCSSNAQIFVGFNVTPALPTASTAPLTARVEFIVPGEQRYGSGGDVISLITPDTIQYGSVSVRSIPSPRQ